MKKVCFVSIFAYPLFNKNSNLSHGGAEVQIYNYSRELSNNYDVSVIVGDFGQDKKEKYEGVNVIKSFKLKKNIINYVLAPFKLFFSLVKVNPDVVINRAAGVEVFISLIYAKLFRKKIIYMVAHDNDVNGNKRKLFRFALKRVDYYIVQNKYQFDNIKKENKVIMNNSYLLKSYQGNHEYILWVSRGEKWKNPEIFINLAKEFPKEKFLMIMPKCKNLVYYEEVLKKVNKVKNIQFIEKVEFSKIQEYFNNAKLFINTSDFEGFPNTFIQASMGGVPLISYKVNPNNIFNDYKIGFCCNGNFKLVIKNIREILENKDLYNVYSNNIYSYIKERHDIKKNIVTLKKVIENM